MNLLVRAILGIRRLTTTGTAFALLIVGALLAVEILGRHSPSDLHDLLAVTALVPLIFVVLARQKRSAGKGSIALSRLGDRLIEGGKALTFQMGLDFRGDPPVRRGVPPVIAGSILILAVASAVLWPLAWFVPHGLRAAVIQVTYLGYLFGLICLWLALAGSILLAAFVPLAVIHDSFVARHRGPGRRPRRGEIIALAVWFGLLFVLGAILPPWVAPVLCGVLTLTYLLGAIPARRFPVQFLWRPRESIQVRSLSWAGWITCEFIVIGLGIQTLTLAACGAVIVGVEAAASQMPLTTLLGSFLAWLGPGLLALLCVQMVLGRLRDPSRRARPTAHVTIHSQAISRREVKRLLKRQGWRTRFAPQPVDPLDVAIEIAAEALPREHPADRWPLVITPADLQRPGLFVRLNRRDEIQKRRRFLAGLEALLKQAKGRNRGGSGYWLSPHYWFVSGLMRDTRPGEDDGDFDIGEDPILNAAVGPPYHRVFPQPVRKHVYDILRGTKIDLIFLEDGLSFKKLRRALCVLFEVFDVHAGRRAAEEIDFRGLAGTRVLIHDFQFDEPFKSELYPEPKYEFLGRARILHIFRDRGGEEELIEPPFDYDRRPAPVAVY